MSLPDSPATAAGERRATVAYVAPFLVYIGLMGIEHALGLSVETFYPIRCALAAAVLLLVSRGVLTLRPSRPYASIGLGALVFAVWIAPDLLFGYRHFWLFENSLFGAVSNAPPPAGVAWRAARVLGSTLLVPILEELFWRGWLMRWLIDTRFLKVPLGAYTPMAFWMVALMFGSEHGPYWEVGVVAGVLYNWWMVRTHNLADCILAHSITNGLLSAYVLAFGQWQYWL